MKKRGRKKKKSKHIKGPILLAECKLCKGYMVSKKGGDFDQCKCGESYIDRDRWFPNERYRLGGEAKKIIFA